MISHSHGDLGVCHTRLLSNGRNFLRVFDGQRQTACCRDAAVYRAWTRKGFYLTRMTNENGSLEEWLVKNSSCPWLWSQQILCPHLASGTRKDKNRYLVVTIQNTAWSQLWTKDVVFYRWFERTSLHYRQEAWNGEKLWTARRDRLSMWRVYFSRNADWNGLKRWGANRFFFSPVPPHVLLWTSWSSLLGMAEV